MKKLFCFQIMVAICLSGFSQGAPPPPPIVPLYHTADTATAFVTYKYTYVMDTTQPDNPVTNEVVLLLNKDKSRYSYKGQAGVASGATSRLQAGNLNMGGQSMFATTGNIFKDLGADLFSMVEYEGGKFFSVEQKIPKISWTVTEESGEFGGLQCQKATGRFKGRDYTAWFCSQLPYSNGPWKLGGLPGLILEAYDTKKEVWFSFVSFKNTIPVTTGIGVPETALKTSVKEFEQYKEALKKDREANAGSNTAGGIVVTGVSMGRAMGSAGGKNVKPRQNNNPVERED